MRRVQTAGGIVIRDGQILLIKKPDGLAFPKGHIEAGETREETAIRELLEETGYATKIVRELGTLTRGSTEDSGEVVDKEITIFLMLPLAKKSTDTQEESEWVQTDTAAEDMLYPEEKAFLLKYLDGLEP
jgi:8-oxo-dGTP pyrophosphatase MutT (NUDIX family)